MRLSSLLPVALAACVATEGQPVADVMPAEQLSPPGAYADFVASMVIPGRQLRTTWAHLPVGTRVAFAVSRATGAGPCPPALGGHCSDLVSPILLGWGRTGGGTTATLTRRAPSTLPGGTALFFQAYAIDPNGRVFSSDIWQTSSGPLACPAIWAPVCGVNGETFGNECEAVAFGWPVEHEGACP